MKKTIKHIRRALCMTLVLSLLTAIASVGVSALETQQGLIKGTVTLDLFGSDATQEQDYYYSDSYFDASGKISNEHLRTLSAAMAITSYKEYDVLVDTIGFGDMAVYDMDTTSPDTMGTVFANKEIDGTTVVLVMFRGDKYYREWASNFISGTEGDAAGFAAAKELTANRLRAYLEENGITKAKYWVVGYSRAGAVANLLGVELNRNLDVYGTTGDDIYVYTIEAAACSADPTVYENIHNIRDCRDLIPYVYPASWGLGLNGVIEEIGDPDAVIMGKQLAFSDSYLGDYKEVNTAAFLNDFMTFLTDQLTRDVYAGSLESYVSRIADIYFSMPAAEQDALMDYLSAVGADIMADSNLLLVLLGALDPSSGDESVNKVANLILTNLDKAREEVGCPLTDEEYQFIKDAVPPLAAVLVPLIRADAMTFVTVDDKTEMVPLYHILTFVGNAEALVSSHLNHNILANLTARDSFYDKRAERVLGDADGDGLVQILDATAIQRRLAMMDVPDFDEALADVDRDGAVSIIDATYIQRYNVLMEVKYPIGEALAE